MNIRAFEYKNDIEDKKNKSVINKIRFEINSKAEINSYLSWQKIKSKRLSI